MSHTRKIVTKVVDTHDGKGGKVRITEAALVYESRREARRAYFEWLNQLAFAGIDPSKTCDLAGNPFRKSITITPLYAKDYTNGKVRMAHPNRSYK